MKNNIIVILLCTFVLLLTACARYSPYHEMVSNQQSMTLLPCPSDSIDNPAEHSMLAIQSTLADADWVIEKLRVKDKLVIGKACKKSKGKQSPDFLKRNDGNCASVEFSIQTDGTIIMAIPNDNKVKFELKTSFDEWLIYLERVYAELRCYNDEKLNERSSGLKITK